MKQIIHACEKSSDQPILARRPDQLFINKKKKLVWYKKGCQLYELLIIFVFINCKLARKLWIEV